MKKKYCLEKGQLQNIVDAARGEPDACPKAGEFIDEELGMEKTREKKTKTKSGDFVDKVISRKVRKITDRILDWF